MTDAPQSPGPSHSPPPAAPAAVPRIRAGARAIASVVAGGLLAVLAVAAGLTPAESGFGTHTQVGLAPCSWAMLFDKPCATCGMTTAFAYAAQGDIGAAFLAQPLGCLLAVGAAAGFWGAVHVAATGSHLARISVKLLRARTLWLFGGAAAAAWAYKWATWA